MKEILVKMKELFAGKWSGEGFAKFPTIVDTAYTEQLEMMPDEYKDAIFFRQKTWYKNNTENNGHTVFWDTGFIILKEDQITMKSVQVGGRIETYELVDIKDEIFTFNSSSILNDPKSIRSQRIYSFDGDYMQYEMNMETHEAGFQNHLKALLNRSEF
jgi:hypothetical protein